MLTNLAYVLLWGAVLAHVVCTKTGRALANWIATAATVVAWGLLAAGLIARAQAAGHLPLTNRYEFALCFAWIVVTIYLLLEITDHVSRFTFYASRLTFHASRTTHHASRITVLAIALLALTYAITRPAADQAIAPLAPALRSVWLQVHVISALVGYAAFGVAAGFAAAQLLISSPAVAEEGQGERVRVMERTVLLGFPWLTLSILSGAIWAQNAWGRYWGWDPKETWALITWLWYLMILHARTLRDWRGRRLATLVIVAFGIVIFTFVGVPWLVRAVRLESLHGF
jgi:ABC-type transport system involved in cytochrome c biogenesis permease subunit